MAIQIHLKIPGIEGESTHKGHEKEIEVRSWAWSVENAAKPGAGGGGGAGKAVPRELVFTHGYDMASPLLAKSCAKGTHLAVATLSARKAGKGPQEFLVITLKNVLVTAVSVSGNGDGIGESVALAYGEIDFMYKPQDAKGGLGPGVGFGWNVKTSKVT
jgi:type VI secretion system secreted protein Hcp